MEKLEKMEPEEIKRPPVKKMVPKKMEMPEEVRVTLSDYKYFESLGMAKEENGHYLKLAGNWTKVIVVT